MKMKKKNISGKKPRLFPSAADDAALACKLPINSDPANSSAFLLAYDEKDFLQCHAGSTGDAGVKQTRAGFK